MCCPVRFGLWLALALSACGGPAPPASPATEAPFVTERTVEQGVDPLDAFVIHVGEPIADSDPRPESESPPAVPSERPLPVVLTPRDEDVRVALEDAEAGKLAAAARRLKGALARIERAAALEDRMIARALLGRRQLELRQLPAARREYAEVLAAWADPVVAQQTVMSSSADETEGLRRLGLALTALGEAYFFEAGQKRQKALALKPPPFTGKASDEAIRQHVLTDVAAWIKKRRALDEEAEQAYRKVIEIRPVPPPRWVIASAAEVGTMLEALVTDFDQLPVPSTIRQAPELLAAYRDAIRDAMAPQRERAKAAYRLCQAMAHKFRHHDAHSQKCSHRLAALEAP
jgi:tetratricopeptide (TPR) repeat protein